MIDLSTLSVRDAEELIDRASSQIGDILAKLHKDTGFMLSPEIEAIDKYDGEQFFVVRLNARLKNIFYYPDTSHEVTP